LRFEQSELVRRAADYIRCVGPDDRADRRSGSLIGTVVVWDRSIIRNVLQVGVLDM
jgi:hypothetical protein